MYKTILERCEAFVANFREISLERREILHRLADYIQEQIRENKAVKLLYVCTHNSRRSHFGQVWASVAADYYGINNITTFSGGTEVTAFNPNAIKTLESSGFKAHKKQDADNPIYDVYYDDNKFSVCFSKTFDHEANPETGFAAVMTCSDAEENCPFIPGCDLRIGTTYHDPKSYDKTILQDEKYLERSNQIAMECLYVFSHIKDQKK